MDCRAVNVLQLLAIIIRLLVLNQSELTLPATREESGLRPELRDGLSQICNEFSIGAGFFLSSSVQISLARQAPGPGLLMFKGSLHIAAGAVVGLMREIITITLRWQLRLLRKAYGLFLIAAV